MRLVCLPTHQITPLSTPFSETRIFSLTFVLSRERVLILHGHDDQTVPIADSAELSIKLVKNGTLKVYKGYPHGMCTTHPEVINEDLLAFIKR